MIESLPLLARTFLIGIAVAAPVGAMGVLCIQRTLSRGWRSGMATGMGIATADALYASAAAFGVAAVSSSLTALQTPLRLVGGAVMVYLGVMAFISPPAEYTTAEQPTGAGEHVRSYASAVALTLTNPMTIMAFAAVFAGAGLAVSGGVQSALVATLGVGLGSLSWWFVLVTGVALARHVVGRRTLRAINRVSGAALVVFGVLATVSVFAR